ncbi:hypothetical protein CUTA107171_03435 [Cupriavidus taiwanensis]
MTVASVDEQVDLPSPGLLPAGGDCLFLRSESFATVSSIGHNRPAVTCRDNVNILACHDCLLRLPRALGERYASVCQHAQCAVTGVPKAGAILPSGSADDAWTLAQHMHAAIPHCHKAGIDDRGPRRCPATSYDSDGAGGRRAPGVGADLAGARPGRCVKACRRRARRAAACRHRSTGTGAGWVPCCARPGWPAPTHAPGCRPTATGKTAHVPAVRESLVPHR